MTDSYPETTNFGLSRMGEGESIQKDDWGVTDGNFVTIDRVLKVLADHDHTGGARLADPTVAPDLTVSTSGGTLPAGQVYYYQVSYIDLFGLETAASPEVSVTTPPPLGVPSPPALSAEETGGTLGSGIYRYMLASKTPGGGVTTTSDPAEVTVETGTTNRILIALPDVPAGVEALMIYRARPGQTQYFYWAESADGADLYDDGTQPEDQTMLAPAYDTSSGTNSVTITLAGGVVPAGVKMWRIYRTSSPGIYDGLNLVHEVSEGLTEEATDPRPDWIDDGSPMFRGQPRRTSTTTAPPPAVGAFAVPGGGTAGQVLAKIDTADYNTQWVNATASASDADLLATGEETISRLAARDTTLALTSGRLLLTYFTARKSETVTQARVICGGTAAAATPTTVLVGVYSVAGNGDLTLIASTPNDTSLFAATGTQYTKSFSASWSKTAGSRYAFAVLVVTSQAAPTTGGISGGAGSAAEVGTAPRLAGSLAGQTGLPSTIANASVANSTDIMYGVVLP